MNRIMAFIGIVALLCAFSASSAMAGSQTFGGGGTFTIGTIAGSTTSVNTSNNVYISYVTANNGQNYGASSKNRAGDRNYATGGGNGSATNIYYQAGQTVGSSTLLDPTNIMNGNTTGWSAQ